MEEISHITCGGGRFFHAEIRVFRDQFQGPQSIQGIEADPRQGIPIAVIFTTIAVDSYFMAQEGTDGDPADNRQLVIQWNFTSDVVNLSDVVGIRVLVQVDDDVNFIYLGQTDRTDVNLLEWRQNNLLIDQAFRMGPQFDHTYLFRVMFLTRSGNPVFFGPFENTGPVNYLEELPPTPTPTPAPVQPPVEAPTATSTPISEQPTATPTLAPGQPTATPQPTDTPAAPTATSTPIAEQPTATPTLVPGQPTPTATSAPVEPTATPVPGQPTSTPQPTNTPVGPTATPTATSTPVPGQPTATPTATPIGTGLVVGGNALLVQHGDGQVDEFHFTTGESGTYIVETHQAPNQDPIDTFMSLYRNGDIDLVATDDDSGNGLFSRISMNLEANTLYVVKVTATSAGAYTIDVIHFVPTPTPTIPPTATPTPTNTPLPGPPSIRVEPLSLTFQRGVIQNTNPPAKKLPPPRLEDQDWSILLQSGTLQPAAMNGAQVQTMALPAAPNQESHVLVQFYQIPDAEEIAQLETHGIHLLNYLPHNAYWASVSSQAAGLSTSSLVDGVRWVAPVVEINRLAPEAAVEDLFPAYAKTKGNRVKVEVSVFADVSHVEAENRFRQAGASLLQWADDTLAQLELDFDQLPALAALDLVEWVEAINPPYETENVVSSQRIHAQEMLSLPYEVNGKDIIVGVWDAGSVYTHTDFGSRLTIVNNVAVHYHATHVAGTIGGSGAGNPNARGLAPQTSIRSYDWNSDLNEMMAGYDNGIRLSNHSYGEVVGWYWNGSGYVDYGNSYMFGRYTSYTSGWDTVVYNKGLIVFKSAGNDRGEGDGPYDSLPPSGTAKNIITIGATLDNDDMTSFSSWGPTDDGRVKPDLCANGAGLTSTMPNNSYGSLSGTSMSGPSACAAGTLLFQYYKGKVGEDPAPQTLKAMMIHAAQDKGRPGPDYTYGWGLINARATADMIAANMWRSGTVTNNTFIPYQIAVPQGETQLKATLVWLDPPGSSAAALNLVNDLDLKLRSPSGTVYLPWVLDKNNPASNATTGVNTVDTVEQVLISNPEAGIWTIEVHGTSVPQGPAAYTVASEFFGSFHNGRRVDLLVAPGAFQRGARRQPESHRHREF